jgi:DNA polymerase-3 subunit epsilon
VTEIWKGRAATLAARPSALNFSNYRSAVLYNLRQSYTPPLEPYEFNDRAIIIDTETVGSGVTVEVVEVALCDHAGEVIYSSLVRPLYGRPPRLTKEQRFDPGQFATAPDWVEAWSRIKPLVAGKLLVAYNAAFDRRALAAMRSRHHQRSAERGWRCAMQMVKRAAGVTRSLSLSDACALYELEGGTHRAAADVLATHRLLKRLCETHTHWRTAPSASPRR